MTDIFKQAEAVGREMEANGGSRQGRINVYACTPPLMRDSTLKGGCGYSIVTIDRDAGVTPMFVKCGHCGGTATSRMYRVDCAPEEVTHEWFRPKSEIQLPEGYSLAVAGDHIRRGGLLLRPIAGGSGKWLAPTPAQREFMKQEQAMFSRMLK